MCKFSTDIQMKLYIIFEREMKEAKSFESADKLVQDMKDGMACLIETAGLDYKYNENLA